MKLLNLLKRPGILMVMFLMMLSSVNAQSRYQHVPRVKVDRNKQIIPSKNNIKEAGITIADIAIVNPVVSDSSGTKSNINEQATVASTTSDVIITGNYSNKRSAQIPEGNITKKVNKHYFTEKVKSDSKLLQVRDVQKTALLGYLIWFIVILVLVIAFFVLAFVFLYLVSFTLYYLFLAFGIGALVILALILILGLVGLI